MAAVRTAQSAHYRAIAAMDRDEKIRCGAYVYFSFLKQFADEAGVGDELDWSVPRDLPPEWYAFFSAMEGTNDGVDEEGPYYAPYGSRRRDPPRPGRAGHPGDHRPTRVATSRATSSSGTSPGTSTSRTPRAPSAATCGSGSTRTCGTAWYWACLVGEGRPLVTVIDHEVPLPAGRSRWRSAPRGCGPTTPSRRRSTT